MMPIKVLQWHVGIENVCKGTNPLNRIKCIFLFILDLRQTLTTFFYGLFSMVSINHQKKH